MKRVLVISGGPLDRDFAYEYYQKYNWDAVISADAGLEFFRAYELMPDLILGDFDTASSETVEWFRLRVPERIRTYPAKKDETDTQLALMAALELEAGEIHLLGALGGRLDHLLGNIQLLLFCKKAGADCLMADPQNRIRLLDGHFSIRRDEAWGKYFSLIPITEKVEDLTLKGFAYELQKGVLRADTPMGVSNEITAETAEITFEKGLLLAVESSD